jgi:hypothetical protein
MRQNIDDGNWASAARIGAAQVCLAAKYGNAAATTASTTTATEETAAATAASAAAAATDGITNIAFECCGGENSPTICHGIATTSKGCWRESGRAEEQSEERQQHQHHYDYEIAAAFAVTEAQLCAVVDTGRGTRCKRGAK